MDLLNALLDSAKGGATDQIGRQFGLDSSQTESVMAKLVPALAAGVQKNTQSADGLAGLTNALRSGGHERYLDEPESLADSGAVSDGNNILGHILGSKDVSRQVAAGAASETGISPDVIKQMLPLVAGVLMGGLSKRTGGGAELEQQDGGGLLGSLLGAAEGADLGDLAGMVGKFLK
jgi:hypothetical protein